MNYITQQNLGGGGRLGNQLFGIAAVLGYAEKFNAMPVYPNWDYEKYFKFSQPKLKTEITHHYHEPYFHFTEIESGILETSYTLNLHGYYQSEKYFENCIPFVEDAFLPCEKMFLKTHERLFHYPITCSIHVRRGDYVNNPYYTQLDMDYYKRAIQHIQANTKTELFMIFSDDIAWCKEYFVMPDINIEFSENNTDIEDLFLMSRCDHNIGANSSFSWWGYYLNSNINKIGVFPEKKRWFGENTVLNVDDLYLKEWVLV